MTDRPRDVAALLPLKARYLEILLSFAEGPRHGYALMQESRAKGQGRLWPAMLYGSLRELLGLGLIEETDSRPARTEDDDRRRYYRLTPRGRRALQAEVRRLDDIVRTARAAGIALPRKA